MAGFGIPISKFKQEALTAMRLSGGVPNTTPNAQAGFFGAINSGVGGLLDTVADGLTGILQAVGPNAQAFSPLLEAFNAPKLLTEQRKLAEANAAGAALQLQAGLVGGATAAPAPVMAAPPMTSKSGGIDPTVLMIGAGILVLVVALK